MYTEFSVASEKLMRSSVTWMVRSTCSEFTCRMASQPTITASLGCAQ